MTKDKVVRFTGEYRFLSNFVGGVEQQYQAAKTDIPFLAHAILTCTDPGKAKRAGRKIKLRKDWNALQTMWNCVTAKFEMPEFKAQLLATGDKILIEGNWWHDTYWGVCTCGKCSVGILDFDSTVGGGQNMLGKLLMHLREDLRNEVSTAK